MKIQDLFDPFVLNDHLEAGRVGTQKHPTLPLLIYNYTHKAAFDPHWGDGTIDYCRGLIVNTDNYEIVSRPFKKFHNLNTPSILETMEENLPQVVPTVTKKYDGSLGIYYEFDGQQGVATRGSFTSPQALWATKQLREYDAGTGFRWYEGYTPLFEIIYNENRIVVQYDFEGLVLIGMVDNETGDEMNPQALRREGRANGFPVVEEVFATMDELKDANKENEEGYVLNYRIPCKPPIKIKVKMADYVRLHRIVTGMNARSVWELLKSGDDLSKFDKGFPEPFTNWLFKWRAKLEESFVSIQHRAVDAYLNRPFSDQTDPRRYRAEYAVYVKTCDSDLKGLLFALFDGKDINGAIWDLIEPRGDDKTFREEGE